MTTKRLTAVFGTFIAMATMQGCFLWISPPPADVVQPTDSARDVVDSGMASDATPPSDAAEWPDESFADSGWPDAGGLAPPDWVPLTIAPIGGCAPFTACGGAIVGTWDTADGCFEFDVDSVLARCPGAMVTRRMARGRGRVVFGSDGFGHRVADAEGEIDFFIPEICARYYSCEMVQSATAAFVTSASCTTTAAGDCNCIARQVTHLDQADFYTTTATEIQSVSSIKRWEYCVAGDRLSYRDVTASGPREPGVVVLRRR